MHLGEQSQTQFQIDLASLAAEVDFGRDRIDQLVKNDFQSLATKFYELSDQFVKLQSKVTS